MDSLHPSQDSSGTSWPHTPIAQTETSDADRRSRQLDELYRDADLSDFFESELPLQQLRNHLPTFFEAAQRFLSLLKDLPEADAFAYSRAAPPSTADSSLFLFLRVAWTYTPGRGEPALQSARNAAMSQIHLLQVLYPGAIPPDAAILGKLGLGDLSFQKCLSRDFQFAKVSLDRARVYK